MDPLTPVVLEDPSGKEPGTHSSGTYSDDGILSSDETHSKKSTTSRHKKDHARKDYPILSTSTSRSTMHGHGRRKNAVDAAEAGPPRSASPFHISSSIHSKTDNSKHSLRTEYKWTEIDMLDDVRQMAQEVFYTDGFPQDFERKIEQTRDSQAQLFNLMKDRNLKLQATKRRTVRDSHIDEESQVHVEDEGMEPFDQEELENTKNEERNYVRNIVGIVNNLR
ncbi:Disordered region of unknown function (DUF5315) [Nakaseomyces bracarensis]|uniref:Uncharacterized protein n=1 Tax=Nakaseomyces bracarensis TaxID=273131 RepID=A0ABR4P171_9SACH